MQFAGMFGARPVLGWTNPEARASVILPFKVESACRYAARLTAVAAPEHGIYSIELDGKVALEHADFRASEYEECDLRLGTRALVKGTHKLSFQALAAKGDRARPIAVEMLRLLRLPPEANRAVKNHNEAHFVRLAIGRAVYAYRLAYDKLPGSLDALVQAGLMSTRYLSDENQQPLRSRQEGNFFVVESNGAEPWTYRWQGLDARR